MKSLGPFSTGLFWELWTGTEKVFSRVTASTEMLRVTQIEGPFEVGHAIHRTLFEEIHRGDVLNDV